MIVLDTHAWIWFVNEPDKLGKRAVDAIENARRDGSGLHISCISSWEVYMLVKQGRLSLGIAPDIWVSRCERLSFIRFHPISNAIAQLAVGADLHADPADRFIAATATYLGATLITKDRKLRAARKINTLW